MCTTTQKFYLLLYFVLCSQKTPFTSINIINQLTSLMETVRTYCGLGIEFLNTMQTTVTLRRIDPFYVNFYVLYINIGCPRHFSFADIFTDLAMHNKLEVDNNLLSTQRTNLIHGQMKEQTSSVWSAIYSILSPFFS